MQTETPPRVNGRYLWCIIAGGLTRALHLVDFLDARHAAAVGWRGRAPYGIGISSNG